MFNLTFSLILLVSGKVYCQTLNHSQAIVGTKPFFRTIANVEGKEKSNAADKKQVKKENKVHTLELSRPQQLGQKIEVEPNENSKFINNILRASGGVDAGGGNTINGKPIDSYIFKYENTEEYKKYILPWRNVIKVFLSGIHQDLRILEEKKRWYKVPVDLPSLKKETVGLPFDSDQGALRFASSVWLQEQIFEKMGEKEKARIIAHEMLLALKFYQKNRAYNFCLWFSSKVEKCQNLANGALSKIDYDYVRGAAYELIEKPEASASEIYMILFNAGFDLSNSNITETDQDLFKQITISKFSLYLNNEAILHKLPSKANLLIGNPDQDGQLITDLVIKTKVISNENKVDLIFELSGGFVLKIQNLDQIMISDNTKNNNSIDIILTENLLNPKIGRLKYLVNFNIKGERVHSITAAPVIYLINPKSGMPEWLPTDYDYQGKPTTLLITK